MIAKGFISFAIWLAVIAPARAIPIDEVAQLSAPDPVIYRNNDYEFSVKLPQGYPACVDVFTNHGVSILLKPGEKCETQYDIKAYERNPHINAWAAYNAAEIAYTPAGIARWHCFDKQARKIIWLHDRKLDNRNAGGCRRNNVDGTVSVILATIRKTSSDTPRNWIEIGIQLTTTPERFESDNQIFESVTKGIRIHSDGPQQ